MKKITSFFVFLIILQLCFVMKSSFALLMNFTYNGPTESNIPITLLINMSAHDQSKRDNLANLLTNNLYSLELCNASQCWNITSFYVFDKNTPYPGLSTVWSSLFLPNESLPWISFVIPNAVNQTNYFLRFVQLNRQNYTISDFISVSNATLQPGRSSFSCAPHGDSIYCFGGHTGSLINQIVRYNVTSNTVTVMSATLPSARHALSCATWGDSIYCFGGYASSYINQIVRYNVTSDTVTVMSATLPTGREHMSCVSWDDSIYCFGGRISYSSRTNQIVRYKVTSNTVTVMSATLPTDREMLSCAPWGDSVYCFGGYTGSSSLNQIVRYNVTSNTVTVMSATLPSARHVLSCAPWGDSIYCFGGYDGTYLNQIVRYNVTSDTVTVMSATLPSARYGLSCATWGDSVFCFGGYDGSYLNQTVRYGSYFLNQNAQVFSIQVNAPLGVYVNQNSIFSCSPGPSLSNITLTLKKGAQILSSTTINNPQVGVWYNLSYLITPNEAHATLTFECTGGGQSASQNVDVLNSNPYINNVSWTTPIVLKNFTIRYNATDIDLDTVLANITVRDINRSVDICTFTSVPINSDRLCFVPAESNSSRLNLTIIVYDNYGGINQTSYTFDVQNNPPTITSFNVTGTFRVNQVISFSASATDPDGHTISRYEYRVRSVTDNYRVARDWSTTPNYTITACADAHDLLEICVRAFDQFNKSSAESCINRLVENSNPIINVTYIQNETALDESTLLKIRNLDPDCDAVTISLKTYILPFWQERGEDGKWYSCYSPSACHLTKSQSARCDYFVATVSNNRIKCGVLMNHTTITVPYNETGSSFDVVISVRYYDETLFDYVYLDWALFYEIDVIDGYNGIGDKYLLLNLTGFVENGTWNYSRNPILFAQNNMTYVWGTNITWVFYDESGQLWNFANEKIFLNLVNSYRGYSAGWNLNSTNTVNSSVLLKTRFSLLPHPYVYFYVIPGDTCVGRVGFREFRPNLKSFSGRFEVLEIPSTRCSEIISSVIAYPDNSLPECIIITKVLPGLGEMLVNQYYKVTPLLEYKVPLIFGHLYKFSVCEEGVLKEVGFLSATGSIKLIKLPQKIGSTIYGEYVYVNYEPKYFFESMNNSFSIVVTDVSNTYNYYAVEVYAPDGSLLLREESRNGVKIEKNVTVGNYSMKLRGRIVIYLFKNVPELVEGKYVNADWMRNFDFYVYRWVFSYRNIFSALRNIFPGRYIFVLYLLLIVFMLVIYYVLSSFGLPNFASFLFLLGFVAILGFSGFPGSVIFILVLVMIGLFIYSFVGG